jgi:hypothetical protein
MNDEQIRSCLRKLAMTILERTSQVDFDARTALAAVRETQKLCEAEVNERTGSGVAPDAAGELVDR